MLGRKAFDFLKADKGARRKKFVYGRARKKSKLESFNKARLPKEVQEIYKKRSSF
jgi:hypothetical protein